MMQRAYQVLGFSSRGSRFPCFVIAFFRKEDGCIYAAYPSGHTVKILEGLNPIADESKLLSCKNVWKPTTAQVISPCSQTCIFAFSSDHIVIGDKPEVRKQIAVEKKLTKDTLFRDALEEAARSLA